MKAYSLAILHIVPPEPDNGAGFYGTWLPTIFPGPCVMGVSVDPAEL
jgi:hypothetical protein